MRILMLNSEYPPLGGGQGNANQSLFTELQTLSAAETIYVDIVTASTDSYKKRTFHRGTIYYLDIGKQGENIHFQSSKELLTYAWRSYKFSNKLLKLHQYDLIVAWSGIPAGFIVAHLAKKRAIPYIILLRGADVPFYDKRWRLLDTLFFRWLSPRIWQKAAVVIANSRGLRELAYTTSQKKEISVIYNGVNTRKFTPLYKKRGTPPVIICVGRLNKIKGFDLVIRAIAEVTYPCTLVIAGDGPEKVALQTLAKELCAEKRVLFVGSVDKKQLIKYYHSASIFCLASYNEGMSNALLEAMACGLPVISTDVGGAEELVRENGILVEKGNHKQIKEGIETILGDSARLEKMSKCSAEIAGTLSWSTIAEQFLQVFTKSARFDHQ